MKKLGKRLFIIIIVGAVLYGAYFLFMKPNGFVSSSAVSESFFSSLSESDVCENHFNSETTDLCTVVVDELDGKTVVVDDVVTSGSETTVTLTVDAVEISFVITCITQEPSGLRGILTNEYYLIDTIK